MSEDLKKIEEDHSGEHYCRRCKKDNPCDVVKLARALDKLPDLLHLAVLGEATDEMLESAHAEVVTTLREVANA